MQESTHRGVTGLTIVIIVAVLIVAIFIFGSHGSSPAAPSKNALSSDKQASTTINQALKLSTWIAKEYPQKKQ